MVRVDAMPQRAIGEHGQIESRAVPGDEHGRVALEAVEEPLNALALSRQLSSEAEDLEPVARAQHDGDGDDALLRRGEEIALLESALLREHRLRDSRIVETVEIV